MTILLRAKDPPGMQVDEHWWEDARHEILNEVNRDGVMAMIIDWIRAQVA